MRRSFLLAVSIAALIAASAGAGRGAATRPESATRSGADARSRADTGTHPTAEELTAMSGAGDPMISPDGRRLVYALTTRKLDPATKPSDDDHDGGWTVDRQLFLLELSGGEPRQITQGKEKSGSPAWSPDGRELAFLRSHGKKPAIQILSLTGGEAVVLETGALEPQTFRWSPDGKSIAFTAEVALTKDEKSDAWTRGGAFDWERQWRPQQLWVVPRAGGEPRRVSKGNEHVAGFEWSPDGSKFLVMTSRSSDPYEVFNLLTPKIVSARDGSVLRTLETEPRTMTAAHWSPDGRFVAYLANRKTLSLLNELRVRSADGNETWDAGASMDASFSDLVWSADSRSLIALVEDRTRSKLVRLPREGGAPADLGVLDRVIDGGLESDRGVTVLAFRSSTPAEPSDPTVFEIASGKSRVVTKLNPQTAGWTLGRTEVVRWTSPEGVELEGLLTVTPSAKPGQAPPLMVYPHGGPDAVTAERWGAFAQYLAAHGYSVFQPNYRGGTAYGLEFYAANRGRFGEIEQMDIESGVDHLIAAGKADPKRLFFGGWSWGGYITAWMIGHSTRYRAAVVGAGVNDVAVSYSLSDINHGVASQWEYKGDPWHQTGNFDRANPIRFLAGARTPTLILHGQSDDRVPFVDGVILYRALADVGCPVEFYAYPRENHGFQEPAHLVHRLKTWTAWYDAHLPRSGAR